MKSLDVGANGGDLAQDCGILAGDAALMDEVGRDIWVDDGGGDHNHHRGHEDDDDLIVHHIFYGTLPDFPCMSSSSSSPAPVNAIVSSASSSCAASSSTSSAASWAILRSDGEDPTHNQNQYGSGNCDESPASTASMEIPLENNQGCGGDGSDMPDTFGYMDLLLDSNEFLDTSAIFSQDDDTQNPNLMDQTLERKDQPMMENNMQMMNSSLEQDDDLATVFLEWLKSNKETVSAEDLRKVKIKKATIESAATRLGGGKEAMKQLLKLILEWVQTNHLRRRPTNSNNLAYQQSYQDLLQNPNPNPSTNNAPTDQSPSTWAPPPQQPAFVSDPGFGYMPAPNYPPPPPEYLPLLESPPQSGAMPHQQFPMQHSQFAGFTGYNMNPYQYPYLPSGQMRDQRLLRLCSSATKEARKKRMARQRRFLFHL